MNYHRAYLNGRLLKPGATLHPQGMDKYPGVRFAYVTDDLKIATQQPGSSPAIWLPSVFPGVEIKPQDYPSGALETRVEIGVNLHWAKENPALLAESILAKLETHPLESWSWVIKESPYPGEHFCIIARKKEEI